MHPGSKYFRNFFKNKKILITGNTGFKGSWMSCVLQEMNAKVFGLSKDVPTKPSNFKCLNLHKTMKTYYGDVSNINFFKGVLKKVKPDIIFHLAAQSIVIKSYTESYNTIKTNSEGVFNLLEILRHEDRKISCVIITSDKCYLPDNKSFFSENDKLGGEDLYSASKAAAEIYIKAYCYSFFKNKKNIKLCSARAGNVIGGGDWSQNRIVPDILNSISKNNDLVLRNPNSNRPWQHVLEPIHGYLVLADNLHNDQINLNSFNIGPSTKKNITVKKISEILFKKLNCDKKIRIKKNFKIKETNKLNLNTSKIRKLTEWRKILNTDETFTLIAEWQKAYNNKDKMEIIRETKSQIHNFFLKTMI